MANVSIHQEDIFIPKFYVFNIISSKHIKKKKETKLKGKLDTSTIRVGDINTLFSWTGSKPPTHTHKSVRTEDLG